MICMQLYFTTKHQGTVKVGRDNAIKLKEVGVGLETGKEDSRKVLVTGIGNDLDINL